MTTASKSQPKAEPKAKTKAEPKAKRQKHPLGKLLKTIYTVATPVGRMPTKPKTTYKSILKDYNLFKPMFERGWPGEKWQIFRINILERGHEVMPLKSAKPSPPLFQTI